jgi:hypothetical protein
MNNAGQQHRTPRVRLCNSSHIRPHNMRATHISVTIGCQRFLYFREQIIARRSVVQSTGTRKLFMIMQGTILRHENTVNSAGFVMSVLWPNASTQQTNSSACNLSSANKSVPNCELFQAFAAVQMTSPFFWNAALHRTRTVSFFTALVYALYEGVLVSP